MYLLNTFQGLSVPQPFSMTSQTWKF